MERKNILKLNDMKTDDGIAMNMDDELALLNLSLTTQQSQVQKELEERLLRLRETIPLGSASQGLGDLSLSTEHELDDGVPPDQASVAGFRWPRLGGAGLRGWCTETLSSLSLKDLGAAERPEG